MLIDECGMSGLTVTHRKKGDSTQVWSSGVLCDGVESGVSESLHRNKSGGMVD